MNLQDYTVVIAHTDLPENPGPDDADTIVSAEYIKECLEKNGVKAVMLPYRMQGGWLKAQLDSLAPVVIFNLVEGVDGRAPDSYKAAEQFEAWGIPFNGCSSRSIFQSIDKVVMKQTLKKAGIATVPWIEEKEILAAKELPGRFILKARFENSSIGLASENVTDDPKKLRAVLQERKKTMGGDWFAEEFLEGREFNMGVIEKADGALTCLPPNEVCFDFPEGLPKIQDFASKWLRDTVQYNKTFRRPVDPSKDRALIKTMEELALKCWKAFGMGGYARVDFRLDNDDNVFVLEPNANPCLTVEDGNFMAAVKHAGMDPCEVIMGLAQRLNGLSYKLGEEAA